MRANHITNTLPRFTPGPEFKGALEKIKYIKANSASPAPVVYVTPESPVSYMPPSPPSPGGPPQE